MPRLEGPWRLWDWYRDRVPDWAAFFLPFLFVPVPVLLGAVEIPEAAPKLWLVQTTSIFALDIAILTGLCAQLEWWLVLGLVLWMELLFLLWLVRNLETLRKWGPMGRFLARQEARALSIYQRKRWIRRFHVVGVMLFVFLPLNSGIIAGVFVARFTGMADRPLLMAVYMGSALWATILTGAIGLSVELIVDLFGNLFPILHRTCG